MRIIIYGAGAIGGVVGGYLAHSNQEAFLIGRAAHVQTIKKNGLKLITPTGTHVLHLPAVTEPNQIKFTPDDVVFLTMKSQDTDEALRNLKSIVSDVPVFCFQNSVRNEEMASKYFPRVYGAMIRIGAVYLSAGEVTSRRDPPGSVVIGRYPKGKDEMAESVAASLRKAGFVVLVSPDVMPYKYGKLLDNLNNAIGAITNVKGKDPDLLAIAHATRQEMRDLLTEAGIRWVTAKEVAEELPEVTTLRGEMETEAQSSTWQSLARKTGNLETEFLNGEVVRLAKKLGRQAPINEKLLKIALEMAANRETPGKYPTSELKKMLGI